MTTAQLKSTTSIPDHDQVRRIIQNSDQYQTPPHFVVRTFNINSFIPNEYRFLLDEGHKRPVTGDFICKHTYDLESFIELAEMERDILANQPDDDEDENEDVQAP